MSVTPAERATGSQTAEQHGAKKNIFPDAQRDDSRGNNDPREAKQPRQNNQPRLDKRDIHGWIVLDKPIGMTSTHAVAVVKRLFSRPSAQGMPVRSIHSPRVACR